ncbi:MAG: hypothetical protein ABIC36_02700 [bacterium]
MKQMTLSKEELNTLTSESIDPSPIDDIIKPHHNSGLSDEELSQRIKKHNTRREPTLKFRQEYRRRLNQIGLIW